jgi:hypothetical protein
VNKDNSSNVRRDASRQLLSVHGTDGVGESEIHTAEPFVPQPRLLLQSRKGISHEGWIKYQQN